MLKRLCPFTDCQVVKLCRIFLYENTKTRTLNQDPVHSINKKCNLKNNSFEAKELSGRPPKLSNCPSFVKCVIFC